MKLRSAEICPLHRSRYCCGRGQKEIQNRSQHKGPVTRIPDDHHPRGYREQCTPGERRRRLVIKLRMQQGICAICHLPIVDVREADLDHIEPKGMGGAWRDDHMDNLQAVHRLCNLEKGSKRL